MKKVIVTDQAPQPIGCYSQAIAFGTTVYLAGQIAINPRSQNFIAGDISAQTQQVFANIQAVCQAAGGDLQNIIKLTIYLMDINHSSLVNEIMQQIFQPPYPARTTIQVAKLPKNALVEMDAILMIED